MPGFESRGSRGKERAEPLTQQLFPHPPRHTHKGRIDICDGFVARCQHDAIVRRLEETLIPFGACPPVVFCSNALRGVLPNMEFATINSTSPMRLRRSTHPTDRRWRSRPQTEPRGIARPHSPSPDKSINVPSEVSAIVPYSYSLVRRRPPVQSIVCRGCFSCSCASSSTVARRFCCPVSL